jgi:flagellar basal-body rod protein FlgB
VHFIDSKTIDVTSLALDGLMQKHRTISANIANAEVAGYKRQDISFEDQLNEILEKDYEKEAYKSANSKISPIDPQTVLRSQQMSAATATKALEAKQAYGTFKPQLIDDEGAATSENGNNVNVEKEMVELAKNTTKYSVLSEVLAKKLVGLNEIIKGAM